MPAHLSRAELSELVDQLGGRMTAAVSELHGLVVNDCLTTATLVLDGNGRGEFSWRVPFGSLSVVNNGPGTLTVTTDTSGSGAPTQGQGVARIAGYGAQVVNMSARTLTLYGSPGASVGLSVYTKPQPPAFGIVGQPASAPATASPAAGQVVTGSGRLAGLAISETTGTGTAKVKIHDGVGAGAPLLFTVTLAANESIRDFFNGQGLAFTTGLYVELVTGAIDGSLFLAGAVT